MSNPPSTSPLATEVIKPEESAESITVDYWPNMAVITRHDAKGDMVDGALRDWPANTLEETMWFFRSRFEHALRVAASRS